MVGREARGPSERRPEGPEGSLGEVGFKEAAYFVKIGSAEELVADTELVRLGTEFFRFYPEQNRFEPFQPFELEFYATNSTQPSGFINIERTSGLVYFNQTISTELLSHNIIQINVACRVLRNQPSEYR